MRMLITEVMMPSCSAYRGPGRTVSYIRTFAITTAGKYIDYASDIISSLLLKLGYMNKYNSDTIKYLLQIQ